MNTATIEWHKNWDSDIDAALRAMPTDPLAEPELLYRIWNYNQNRIAQKIGIVRNQLGESIGVVPLKRRGQSAWQLLNHYCLPYAKLLVLPEYTDIALRLLSRDVDCPNIACPTTPTAVSYLRPEESWVVDTTKSYQEIILLHKYRSQDRRVRARSSNLRLIHDNFDDVGLALDEWQRKWVARGSKYTAVSRDEIEIVCKYMEQHGRLKTISLWDGDKIAGLAAAIIADGIGYGTFLSVWDDYRSAHAGVRLALEMMEWACSSEITALDMLRTSSLPKHKWAEPRVSGYRLVRCPLGSEMLGIVMSRAKDYVHAIREQRAKRLQQDSLASRATVDKS